MFVELQVQETEKSTGLSPFDLLRLLFDKGLRAVVEHRDYPGYDDNIDQTDVKIAIIKAKNADRIDDPSLTITIKEKGHPKSEYSALLHELYVEYDNYSEVCRSLDFYSLPWPEYKSFEIERFQQISLAIKAKSGAKKDRPGQQQSPILPDPFSGQFWNLVQLISWVCLKDKSYVRYFTDENKQPDSLLVVTHELSTTRQS